MEFPTLIKLVIFVCAILALQVIKLISGVGPIELIKQLSEDLLMYLAKRAGKKKLKHEEKFSMMSKKEKLKNSSYKFYSFVNEILLDIGWRDKGITVEGFNTFIDLIVGVLAIVFYLWLKNLFFTAIVSGVIFILMYAVVFLLSRLHHTKRKNALMDAEDFLCSSMSQGIVQAVEDNYKMMDKSIQPIFEDFVRSIYDRNVDVYTAIDTLNEKCGEQFDDFCEKAKAYERERRPGMEDIFQYNIAHNAFVRELDRECSKAFSAMNKNFLMSIGIILGFICYNMLSYADIRHFYFSGFGKALLVFYFVIVALVFVYIQYIQSKPFKYGK